MGAQIGSQYYGSNRASGGTPARASLLSRLQGESAQQTTKHLEMNCKVARVLRVACRVLSNRKSHLARQACRTISGHSAEFGWKVVRLAFLLHGVERLKSWKMGSGSVGTQDSWLGLCSWFASVPYQPHEKCPSTLVELPG